MLTHPEGLTAKQCAFLDAYAKCGTQVGAAKAAKVERKSHFNWYEKSEEYRLAFAEAQKQADYGLVDEAVRRAKKGSDTLMIFLLKGAFPKKYRDNYTYIDGRLQHNHTVELPPREALKNLSEEELNQLESLLSKINAPPTSATVVDVQPAGLLPASDADSSSNDPEE